MAGTLIEIDAPDDPRLAPYRNVRDAHLRATHDRSEPLFMCEGEVVVRQLIGSRYPVHSMLLTPTRLGTAGDLLRELPIETPVYCVSQQIMDGVTGFHIHRGLLAAGHRVPEPALSDLLDSPGPLVVLEDLANHDNVGGIFRNAGAFGATGVLLSPRCADPLYRKGLRVSVGQALRVPFAGLSPWPLSIRDLVGWSTVALVTDPDAWTVDEASERLRGTPVALVVGAEGPGLSGEAIAACAHRVRIPMAAGVDSLNVAQACGIALHRFWTGHEGSPGGA